MPQGPTHRAITLGLTVVSSTIGAGLLGWNPNTAPYSVAFLLGVIVTIVVNPDNDLSVRRLPWIYRWLGFSVYKDVVQHRQGLRKKDWRNKHWTNYFFYSHLPYVGTLLRTGLLLFPVVVVCLSMSILLDIRYVLLFWLGMGTSDLLHILADLCLKENKDGTTIRWPARNRKSSTHRRRN